MDMLQFWVYVGYIIGGILGVFFLYMEAKYKMRVTIKEVTKDTVLLKYHKARLWTDKDKVAYWKITKERNKERKLLDLPPEECIELDYKGRKCAECYRFESGETVWIRDDFKATRTFPVFNDLPEDVQKLYDKESDPLKKKEIQDTYKKLALEKWKKDNRIISPYQPVTTNQRMTYFNNIKKAEERKGFDWKEKIVPLAAISGLVLIVLGLMIFWGEIAAPALQADNIAKDIAKTNERNQEINLQIVQLLQDIKLGQQNIQTTQAVQNG